MPNRPITVRRWQILASFLALAAAFTAGLLIVNHYVNRVDAVAQRADSVARRADDLARQNANLRHQRLKDVSAADVKLCRAVNSIRELNNRDLALLRRQYRETLRALPRLTGTLRQLVIAGLPQQRREIAARRFLPLLTCKRLPTSTQTKDTPGTRPDDRMRPPVGS